MVFLVVTLCSMVGGYRCLGGTEVIVVRMWPGEMEGCDKNHRRWRGATALHVPVDMAK